MTQRARASAYPAAGNGSARQMRTRACLGVVSALDVGLRPIIAGRNLVMPKTVLVFIGDTPGLSANDLFPCRSFRGFARHVVRPEGFGEHAIDPVSPAAVVFDDFVRDLAHLTLPIRVHFKFAA